MRAVKRWSIAFGIVAVCAWAPAGSEAATMTGTASAYSPCDGSVTIGSRGNRLNEGDVASNALPYGTWIEMVRPRMILNRRWFRVRDVGAPGMFLIDVFTWDCSWMNRWGRRTVTIRPLTQRDLYRGKPIAGWRVVAARRGGKLVWRPR